MNQVVSSWGNRPGRSRPPRVACPHARVFPAWLDRPGPLARALLPPLLAAVVQLVPASAWAAAPEPPAPPEAVASEPDSVGPIISDVACAAENPQAAPIITALVSDDVSVAKAVVRWRVGAEPWVETVLGGHSADGVSSLFLARLPDGVQRQGFVYVLEVQDDAGNVTRVGSEQNPLIVPPAVESTAVRMARQAQEAEVANVPAIHPGWIMLSLGVGVLAGGGASVFAIDLAGATSRQKDAQARIDGGVVTGAERVAAERFVREMDQAIVQDAAATAVFGVMSVAALVTGGVLLVMAATTEPQ